MSVELKSIQNYIHAIKRKLVERALVKELKEVRRRARQDRWKEGAKDPVLLRDISEVEIAFQSADAETSGRID